MSDDIIESMQKLQSMDGSVHQSFNSNVMWPKSSPPSPTKEEAVDQARADAIKKGKSFAESKKTDLNEADEKAINKYVDDLLENLF